MSRRTRFCPARCIPTLRAASTTSFGPIDTKSPAWRTCRRSSTHTYTSHGANPGRRLTSYRRSRKLSDLFRAAHLKVATQKYTYHVAGTNISEENTYAVLQGPRADATEALVLIAAWRNMDGDINYSGLALVLAFARYFKRWSLWSKDIIFLISGDSTSGPQAWVDAYHDSHDASTVESLAIKSGALQGAVAVDYPAGPWGHRFDRLHIVYDGVNGQLPNLDLFNTAVSIASGQTGIACTLQRMWQHSDTYQDRLQTMLRGMLSQGLGHATGPHSSFIPYHVDAITLVTVGDGWHDEMSLGRTVESLFRSLNNLLEHLHQSFFFYLLLHANRFVSIGTYLPSAMLIAANFSIMAIALWVQSGRQPTKPTDDAPLEKRKWGGPQYDKAPTPPPAEAEEATDEREDARSSQTPPTASANAPDEKPDSIPSASSMTAVEKDGAVAVVPTSALEITERSLFFPLSFVLATHFLGLLPLYVFNSVSVVELRPDLLPSRKHHHSSAPSDSLLPPPSEATDAAADHAHPLLCTPAARHVLVRARHPQLQPLLHHRSADCAAVVHPHAQESIRGRRHVCVANPT